MPFVSLHIHTITTKLFGDPAVLVVYYQHDNETAAISRWLSHRGVTHQFAATRECSEKEYKANAHRARYKATFYEQWDPLFTDERKYTDDPVWYGKMAQIRMKYPQFDTIGLETVAIPPVPFQPTLF